VKSVLHIEAIPQAQCYQDSATESFL